MKKIATNILLAGFILTTVPFCLMAQHSNTSMTKKTTTNKSTTPTQPDKATAPAGKAATPTPTQPGNTTMPTQPNQATAPVKRPILNHIAVSVKNLAKSTAFYSQIIQLDTIPEPFHDGRHTWFSIAEHSHLHLIQYDDGILVPAKGSHLCFSVVSIEDFIKRLESSKIPYSNWQGDANAVTLRVDGVKQIYLQDPDGYWIEINNDKY